MLKVGENCIAGAIMLYERRWGGNGGGSSVFPAMHDEKAMSDGPCHDNVKRHFAALLQTETEGHRIAGWGSATSQRRRFEVLADIGDLRGARILDVGCGLGAFHDWLRAREIDHDYHACDVTSDMVAAARARTGLSTIRLGSIDAVEDDGPFDFVFASGIFFLSQQDGHRTILDMADRMLRLADRGVAFNCLSARAETKEAGEFYADPGRCLNDCLGLTCRAVLRHDYHPADFTVYLYPPSR